MHIENVISKLCGMCTIPQIRFKETAFWRIMKILVYQQIRFKSMYKRKLELR